MDGAGSAGAVDEGSIVTCQQCQQEMPEVWLDPGEEGPTRLHLQSCPDCAQQWQQLHQAFKIASHWEVDCPDDNRVERALARVQAASAPWWRGWFHSIDLGLQRFGQHRLTLGSGALTALLALGLMVKVLSPNYLRGRSTGAEFACQRNLRLLRQALAAYALDHQGLYPPSLMKLKPRYLKVVPQCPESQSDEFVAYRVQVDHRRYRLQCPHHPH